jgi:eukaryotic-like serine/threonine-protein kinase
VPITIGSSVVENAREPSRLSRLLPRSRMRVVALAGAVAIAGGAYAVWRTSDRAEPQHLAAAPRDATALAVAPAPADAAPDPAAEIRTTVDGLVAAGHNDAALSLLLKARREHPDRAELPYLAGKLYFAKMWWADGVTAFRDAIRLDASYRNDPEMIRAVIRGFVTTPEYDPRIGNFLVELGDAAQPALDDTAHNHPNPQVRARAAAQLRRTPTSTK